MPRKNYFYLGLVLAGAVLLIAAAVLFLTPSTSSPAITSANSSSTSVPSSDIKAAQNGDLVEFVGQITAIQGTVLTVEILEGTGTDNVFNIRTGQFVEVVQTTAPEIVMGTSADIFVGALGQFQGTKTGDNQIQLTRIVILTSYVVGPTP